MQIYLGKIPFCGAVLMRPAICQVDALLGRRNSHTEHEALREMKNEFMAHWDGIRATAKGERVSQSSCADSAGGLCF